METIWECVIHCTECPDSPKLLTANQLKTINNRAEQYINQSIQPYGELASVYRRKYQTSNLTSTPTTSFYSTATTDNKATGEDGQLMSFQHSRMVSEAVLCKSQIMFE